MNSSREELIELTEISSPTKEKPKKRNKVDLSPLHSVTSISSLSDNANIINIFSTTPKSYSERRRRSETHTISEISDGVFVKPNSETSTSKGESYKQKVAERLRKIREKASTTPDGSKKSRKIPVERVRRESQNVDVEVETVRSRLNLNAGSSKQEREAFFNFSAERPEDKSTEENSPKLFAQYNLPEQLYFNTKLSEKDHYFIPKRKHIDINSKVDLSDAPDQENETMLNKISKNDINLLGQRLLAIDDKRWFDNQGKLHILSSLQTNKTFNPKDLEPDQNLASYKLPSFAEECNEIIVVQDRILNVYLSDLKFTYHSLFSVEHVFVEKLRECYEKYKNNNLENMKKRLDDLRVKRNNIQSGDSTSKALSDIENEIQNTRTKYFQEAENDRVNIKEILETWRRIKNIRKNQKYSNTTVILRIIKEQVDLDEEADTYNKNFDITFTEMLREHKNNFNNKEDIEIDENHENEDPDRSVCDIDEEKLKQKLSKCFKKCFRQPGEPLLKFLLVESNEITENVPNRETSRRNAVASSKVYLRIMCNNIEACRTPLLTLDETFVLDVNETFDLQLTNIPDCLTIEVVEQPKTLSKKKICEMNINLPSSNKTSNKLYKKCFSKNEIIHYKHEGLGSGIDLKTIAEKANLKVANRENRDLKTSGYLEYSIAWEEMYEKEKKHSYEEQFKLLDSIVDKNFAVDPDKLKDFVDKLNEGSDQELKDIFPANVDLELGQQDGFRLNAHQERLQFCNISEIEQNLRLTILRLRDQKEIEFDGIPVPNRIREIPCNALADYKRRKAIEERGLFCEEEEDEEDEFEKQRSSGKKYLKQIHIKVFQRCKNMENNLDYDSVVNEKYLINFHLMIRTWLKNIINWFRWRPRVSKPLPILGERSLSDQCDFQLSENVFVTVNVICAKNVPNRAKTTFNEDDLSENDVQPFVRVTYKNSSVRTCTSKGVNPTWNETLRIQLESMHMDYLNPNSLSGSISFDIFDENDIELRKLGTKCSNWLGGIEISLSGICCDENLQGLFEIKRPYIVLGYQTEEEKLRTKTSNSETDPWQKTYLHMIISLQPHIPKLTPNMEELPSGEVPYIQERILKWNNDYNCSYPSRKFTALVMNTNAKTTCVTRFIKALEPPPINLEEFDVTAEQCLRYVSLIPFTECNHFYTNVWLSTKQLLHLMIGSITDHAVALTCYLLALKIDVWLLLGYGIPHGNTAYVLVKELVKETDIPNFYVLDVIYNEKYKLTDDTCPLRRIFCLINGENDSTIKINITFKVWANTQSGDNIPLTRFDLSRRSDWSPLFTNDFIAPSYFIANSLTYKPRNDVDYLEMHLQKQLKKQISKLRQLDRTVWNNKVSSIFKNVLRTFEMNCMYNKNHQETISELYKSISTYRVTGYVVNVAFTSFSAIVKRIKSLGIHIQNENNTEFAIAVHLHPYSNNVLSLWIFVANIESLN